MRAPAPSRKPPESGHRAHRRAHFYVGVVLPNDLLAVTTRQYVLHSR
jgi:hypothetical protein